jgi:NAD(P)-dependent dehydrogenase (short-subunit alcohol dehydrogenase family)
VRVVCIRSDALPETWPPMVGDDGAVIPIDALPHGRFMLDGTVLGRLPTLQEVADTAAFLASDRASAITRTVVNVSSGSALD